MLITRKKFFSMLAGVAGAVGLGVKVSKAASSTSSNTTHNPNPENVDYREMAVFYRHKFEQVERELAACGLATWDNGPTFDKDSKAWGPIYQDVVDMRDRMLKAEHHAEEVSGTLARIDHDAELLAAEKRADCDAQIQRYDDSWHHVRKTLVEHESKLELQGEVLKRMGLHKTWKWEEIWPHWMYRS